MLILPLDGLYSKIQPHSQGKPFVSWLVLGDLPYGGRMALSAPPKTGFRAALREWVLNVVVWSGAYSWQGGGRWIPGPPYKTWLSSRLASYPMMMRCFLNNLINACSILCVGLFIYFELFAHFFQGKKLPIYIFFSFKTSPN